MKIKVYPTISCMVLGLMTQPVVGYAYTRAEAIQAIVGEAENQGLQGMIAVAEAIRNRGHLRGVYGVNSPRLSLASAWVWKQAERAWEASETSNLVGSATHWESTDFPTPSWAEGAEVTAHIGKHIFYKGVK